MLKFLSAKHVNKKYNKTCAVIKLHSFRKFSYKLYVTLFNLLSKIYLDKLYIKIQHLRFNFFSSFLKYYFLVCSDGLLFNLVSFSSLFSPLVATYFNADSMKQTSLYYIHNCLESSTKLFFLFYQYIYSGYLLLSVPLLNYSNSVSLPKNKKVFTVLRSPHTDKKSREQFQLLQYTNLFIDNLGIYQHLTAFDQILSFSSLFINIRNKLLFNY